MNGLRVFLRLDEMLAHHRVMPSIKFAGTHFYTRVERGTARVTYLAQEHNTMTPARTRAQAAVEFSALTMRSPRHEPYGQSVS